MSAELTGDELYDLRVQVRELLASKEYFSNASAASPRPIGIVLEDAKDIDARISLLTSQAGGLAVLIMTPGGKNPFPNEYPPKYQSMVVARVYEKPVVNRGLGGIGEPGGKVATAIYKMCHQETLPMGCMLISMERQPGNDPRYQTHDVFIETKMQLSAAATERISTVAPAQLVDGDGAVFADGDGWRFTE